MGVAEERRPFSGLVKINTLMLRQVETPLPEAWEVEARDQVWEQASTQNPALFDGPLTLVAGADFDGCQLSLTWASGMYRNFALRRVPGSTSWLPAFFVAVVQPTGDGRFVVGRMSETTAAPGRWQLPGGTVDPPRAGEPMDERFLAAHAALELGEEIGVEVDPDDLRLRAAIGADRGNFGLLYSAPMLPESMLHRHFEMLRAAEAAAGRVPEFAELVLVDADGAAELEPQVEYLDDALRLAQDEVQR